jgi:hypothetical protein
MRPPASSSPLTPLVEVPATALVPYLAIFAQRLERVHSTVEAAKRRTKRIRREGLQPLEFSSFPFIVHCMSHKVYFLKQFDSCVSVHVSLSHSQIALETLKHQTLTKPHSQSSKAIIPEICQNGGLGKNPQYLDTHAMR